MSGLTSEHHYSPAVRVRGEGKIIFLTQGFGRQKIVSVFHKVFLWLYSMNYSFSLSHNRKGMNCLKEMWGFIHVPVHKLQNTICSKGVNRNGNISINRMFLSVTDNILYYKYEIKFFDIVGVLAYIIVFVSVQYVHNLCAYMHKYMLCVSVNSAF